MGRYSLVVHGHEMPAADPGHHRVHDAKTEHDSDGGVHGATPLLRHDITEMSKHNVTQRHLMAARQNWYYVFTPGTEYSSGFTNRLSFHFRKLTFEEIRNDWANCHTMLIAIA